MFGASMSEPLSVLIVGCGDIASGFDERSESDLALTHAGAYSQDSRFEIVACVEPDSERRATFMAKWGVAVGYPDLISCLEARRHFDVASICTPTDHHETDLDTLLEADVRCVFAEKPLTEYPNRSKLIVEAYEKEEKSIAVNYLRRWDDRLVTLRDELHAGKWGKVQAVGGLYAKGILNCGSHFFDLVHYLIGPLKPRAILGLVDDGRDEDPTLSVFLETKFGAPVNLIGTHSEAFFAFEVNLIMENGHLSLEDLGYKLRCRRVVQHPTFLHQRALDEGEWQDTGIQKAMVKAVNNIHDHLTMNVPLASDGRGVLQVEELCAKILEMEALKEGDRV